MADTVLTGTLERISYASETSAWTVGRLEVDAFDRPISIVGSLYHVSPGERLRLVGDWVTDARFGRQFRFHSYTTLVPATVEGIRRYLSSGLVDGIGEELARRLVGAFGERTLDVIELEPERLREVDGIGPKRADLIRKAYNQGRAVRDVMVFLHSHGVSTHFAGKIYERYEDSAVRIVRGEPYRLAEDIAGIGFLSADRIAREVGIGADAPERAEAGLLHCLGEFVSEGNIYAPEEQLFEAGEALLQVDRVNLERALVALQTRRAVIVEELEEELTRAVFLPWLHIAESRAATALAVRLSGPRAEPSAKDWALVAGAEEEMGVTLAEGQRRAVALALRERVLVVTGGPGTGKTTIVRGILRVLSGKGLRVKLAAPTGRASRRLQEAAGHPASTLHRLLEFSPKGGGFTRDEENPLPADAVVVDEASMIDASLFYALLRALTPAARLILVGDADQLPSVGPGSVLADLIASRRVPFVRLDEVFRQSQQSAIVRNAYRILRGEPLEAPGEELQDFYVIEKDDPEEILDIVRRLLTKRIPERFGMDARADVQVLAPMYRGLLGTDNLNAELQTLLNASGAPIKMGGGRFRVGDKVMQVRNDYDKDVFNGDVGLIRSVDANDKTLAVSFDGRLVTYASGELHELVLAYAVSVHKSQGSEYPAVIIPLHTQHFVMLQRNLFYTAVTRGRRLVVVVGSRRAISRAIGNDRMAHRYTRLRERIEAQARSGSQ